MAFKLGYEEILNKIIEQKGLSREEIENRVKSKLDLLGDLISKQGAIHIVANDLSVNVFESTPRELKIDKIVPGLNSININVKVLSLPEKREFKTEKRQGVVCNILVGDEGGVARLVIWDTNLIDKLSNVVEGDIISMKAAYSKENNGFCELHLGTRSEVLINPNGVSIGEVSNNMVKNVSRKNIVELKENDSSEIVGTLVQLFEPRFYNSCPSCNKKVEITEQGFRCATHGVVEPRETPILNFFFDDGTDNIRVVCFRENVYGLLSRSDLDVIKEQPAMFDSIKENVIGKQLVIRGRVTKNAMFDRLEFSANAISELNPKVLIEELEK